MSAADRLWEAPPFGLAPDEKVKYFTEALADLTASHRRRCPPYRNILGALGFDPASARAPEEFPFLPVGLFKNLELCSVPPGEVARVVTSSGTWGGPRNLLDGPTADGQRRALAAIVSDFIGPDRLPMLVIDCPSVLRGGRFTARAAGVAGFASFGRGRTWALGDDMRPDLDAVSAFLETYGGKPFLLFGFTFLVWQFFEALAASGRAWDFQNGVLIHGGGWKTLADRAVAENSAAGWRRVRAATGARLLRQRNRPDDLHGVGRDTCM
ncbi:MAG: hypothetical protein ACLVL7_12835 [Anaerotruncus massiliensis (ex Togo et al. 2019)]